MLRESLQSAWKCSVCILNKPQENKPLLFLSGNMAEVSISQLSEPLPFERRKSVKVALKWQLLILRRGGKRVI